MTDPAELLGAYDEQLRDEAEAAGADTTARVGPLLLVTFPGGRGLVTYRVLDRPTRRDLRGLVLEALAHFEVDPAITQVEWKTRGHDIAPGLHEVLVDNGFVARTAESVMLGEARRLAEHDVELAEAVTLRSITEEPLVRAMSAMADEVFGEPVSEARAMGLWQRLRQMPGIELWVAEAAGDIVGSGRLEPVPRSDFAGIWGGTTRPRWRGRGIYRALTVARARSALRMGRTLIHSDSTEFSRPILQRAGLTKVSTTTPYVWTRNPGRTTNQPDDPGLAARQ